MVTLTMTRLVLLTYMCMLCVRSLPVAASLAGNLQLGDDAVVREGEGTLDEGKWQDFALSWPEVVIGGGTPNIQKNIIAERILGLPKD